MKRTVYIKNRLIKLKNRLALLFTEILGKLKRGEHLFAISVAILIGVLSAYGAILFRYLIGFVHECFFQTDTYTLNILNGLPWWKRLILPTFGGLLVGVIVQKFAPEVKGSGIPEVMESVSRKGGSIRPRVVITKAVAAALTIGSGGSAGREGPIVHIGSAIGSAVGQFLQTSARKLRTFVACGAAAAIAATFNAPISGALFAVEVVLNDIGVASLSPIVISSVIATVISRHHLGDFPAFNIPAFQFVSAGELIFYAILGILTGLISYLFIKSFYSVGDFFEERKMAPWVKPGIGGLLVGLISLEFPHVYGVGYETINAAMLGSISGIMLIMIVFAKLAATSLTLGSGASGGVFAPSLFLGAALGSGWGQWVHSRFPEWTADPGAYAMVGMGAVVSATTHAPITAILMIFELTNNYKVIPPLMLACVISLLISGKLSKESIYTGKLLRKGIKLEDGRDINLLKSIKVNEVMDTEFPYVTEEVNFSMIVSKLFSIPYSEVIVIDRTGRLTGTISLSDIKSVLPDSEAIASLVVAADIVNEHVPFVIPDDNLDLVMHHFGKIHREEIPVCNNASERKVVGMITRDGVIESYNKKIFQADLTGGFHSLIDSVKGGRMIEVLGGVQIAEIEVPGQYLGMKLKETDLRKKLEVEVVLIHLSDEDIQFGQRPAVLPGPEVVLKPGYKLLVMGTREAIGRLNAQ